MSAIETIKETDKLLKMAIRLAQDQYKCGSWCSVMDIDSFYCHPHIIPLERHFSRG